MKQAFAKLATTNDVPGWFSSLDPHVQAALVGGGIFAGGQMATGGFFAGITAEKQLALQRLIADRKQNQVQYLNTNNQFAPPLKFKPVYGPAGGLLNSVGGS